jgi:hypothetical protein
MSETIIAGKCSECICGLFKLDSELPGQNKCMCSHHWAGHPQGYLKDGVFTEIIHATVTAAAKISPVAKQSYPDERPGERLASLGHRSGDGHGYGQSYGFGSNDRNSNSNYGSSPFSNSSSSSSPAYSSGDRTSTYAASAHSGPPSASGNGHGNLRFATEKQTHVKVTTAIASRRNGVSTPAAAAATIPSSTALNNLGIFFMAGGPLDTVDGRSILPFSDESAVICAALKRTGIMLTSTDRAHIELEFQHILLPNTVTSLETLLNNFSSAEYIQESIDNLYYLDPPVTTFGKNAYGRYAWEMYSEPPSNQKGKDSFTKVWCAKSETPEKICDTAIFFNTNQSNLKLMLRATLLSRRRIYICPVPIQENEDYRDDENESHGYANDEEQDIRDLKRPKYTRDDSVVDLVSGTEEGATVEETESEVSTSDAASTRPKRKRKATKK